MFSNPGSVLVQRLRSDMCPAEYVDEKSQYLHWQREREIKVENKGRDELDQEAEARKREAAIGTHDGLSRGANGLARKWILFEGAEEWKI
eukprot:761524-Hanusia_phi.AAC.2